MLEVVPCIAAISAFVLGALLAISAARRSQDQLRKKELKRTWHKDTFNVRNGLGFAGFILNRIAQYGTSSQVHTVPKLLVPVFRLAQEHLNTALILAGMQDVAAADAWNWRVRTSVLLFLGGMLFGLLFSPSAAVLLGVCGFICGWRSVPWALRVRAKERKNALERHVSEAIEVMCLGLRAGLSFDRSLELYYQNFESSISREFASAQQLWNTGLQTREAALRGLSKRYDSQIFQRVIDSIARSLHFGSPLAASLEELARQARLEHRARVEEAVMKAPVKMMLPIGLLILPSMLLLVMGPVMLELIQGF